MEIRQPLTIDLARQLPAVPVAAVQGDGNTRVLEITLLENGSPWQIPEEAVVDVAFRKSDGTKGIYSRLPDGTTAASRSGNVLSATLAPQMLTCPGTVLATVVFRAEGGKTLAAFPFTVKVEANPAAGAQLSEDYFNPKDLSDLRAEIAAVAAYARTVGAPHNLLDNSDFTNPVNQRGKTCYEGVGYGIDRWRCSSGNWNVTVEEGCIRFASESLSTTGMLTQDVPITPGIRGKTVTFAARVKGDYVRLNINGSTSSYHRDASDWVTLVKTAVVPSAGTTFPVSLQNNKLENTTGFLCRWAALYEGEYTADTLPAYQPKGYAAELLNCGGPLMLLATEHRTMEQHMGKPVYSKWISVAGLPNAAVGYIYDVIPYGAGVVSVEGYADDGAGEIANLASIAQLWTVVNENTAAGYIGIKTSSDLSGSTGYITVKYTKGA